MGDDIRRERAGHCIGEFQRRILERMLPVDGSECQDFLRNCPPHVARRNGQERKPRAFEYVTMDGLTLLRINDLERENRACLGCELFGRNHCCGGLAFLVWVLRQSGIARPAELLADHLPGLPGFYSPSWEKMEANLEIIRAAMESFFEQRLHHVDGSA